MNSTMVKDTAARANNFKPMMEEKMRQNYLTIRIFKSRI